MKREPKLRLILPHLIISTAMVWCSTITHLLPWTWGSKSLEQLSKLLPIFVSFLRCGVQLCRWEYTMTCDFHWEFRKETTNPVIISETPTIPSHCTDDPSWGQKESKSITQQSLVRLSDKSLSFYHLFIMWYSPLSQYKVLSSTGVDVSQDWKMSVPMLTGVFVAVIVFPKWPTKLKCGVLEPLVSHAHVVLTSHGLITLSGYPASPKWDCQQMRGVKKKKYSSCDHRHPWQPWCRIGEVPAAACDALPLEEIKRGTEEMKLDPGDRNAEL